MSVGGVHIIPLCRDDSARAPAVSHSRRDALAGCSSRKDALLPGIEGIVAGRSEPLTSRLILLASYVVELFQEEWQTHGADKLAECLLEEIRRESRRSTSPARPRPQALTRMQLFAMSHLSSPLSLEDLLRVAGCSPTSAHRLFLEFEGLPPMRWLMIRRLEQAARLLCTTSLQVGEIAGEVGFEDPFHFSRAFRTRYSLSPSHFRRAHPHL